MTELRQLLGRSVFMGALVVTLAGLAIQVASAPPASAQGLSDLQAQVADFDNAFLPVTATSAQAGTTQVGTRQWGFFLGNRSPTTVTNPSVSVTSGYNATPQTMFTWNDQPISGFPVADSQSALESGQVFTGGVDGLNSNVAVTYTLGFNSAANVTPPVIPVRGGNQKVNITVTLTDPRYAQGTDVFGGMLVAIGSDLPGVSVVSTTGPSNLNQGEQLAPPPGPTPWALWQWGIGLAQLNKAYSFSAVIHVANASRRPFKYRPFVRISGDRNEILCSECSGSSVTIPDATLDGDIPESGGATFSVNETTDKWEEIHAQTYMIQYMGTS